VPQSCFQPEKPRLLSRWLQRWPLTVGTVSSQWRFLTAKKEIAMAHLESMFDAIRSGPLGKAIRVLLMICELADIAAAPTALELEVVDDIRYHLTQKLLLEADRRLH
jgi:hypothetical protein